MSFDGQWHPRTERRLERIERNQEKILRLLRGITQGEEQLMSQQDEINTLAQQIQSSEADQSVQLASMVTAYQALVTQIQNNPSQPAAQLDLSALHAAADAVTKGEQDVTVAAASENSPSQPPVDPPVQPTDNPVDPSTPTVDPNAPSVDPSTPTVDPSTPTVDPNAPQPVDPNAPQPVDPNAPDPNAPTDTPTVEPSAPGASPSQPVYTFTGDAAPQGDPGWPRAPFNTPDGQPLYYFASDAPGSAPNGDNVGGTWHVYDPSQGVVAATDAPPTA